MAAALLDGGAEALMSSVSPRTKNMLEGSSFNEIATLECARQVPIPARKVSVSDLELRRRVDSIQITTGFNNAWANMSLSGWKWKRDCSTFSLFTRSLETSSGATIANAQVMAIGTISGSQVMEKLVSLSRSPSESDFNNVMQRLYKRDFIYGSLVHSVPADATVLGDGTKLMVKTCAFVRLKRFSHKKNEQMCYIEQFRPTKDGFALVFTSLPEHELLAGKASGKHVDETCPLLGWLLVEKTTENNASVRVLFYAGIDPARSATFDPCTATRTVARLHRLTEGMCRLGDMLHHERQMMCTVGPSKNSPRACILNSHCIACTSKFDLLRRRRRCGLCAYHACAKCCYRESIVIYKRYVATIELCARCREGMIGGEYTHLQLAPRRHSSGTLLPSFR